MRIRTENPSAAGSVDATVARICWYHYKEGLTQQEVADRVGVSRATVNKIVSEARASGLVRIEIDSPFSPCLALECELVRAYALQEAVVVPAPAREEDAYSVVGQAAGDYVSRRLRRGEIIGITWGTTLHYAAQALAARSGMGNTVVSLSGGLPLSRAINPYDSAARFARTLDAACYYLTAPMIVEDKTVREALLASKSVRSVLEMAWKIDLALLTVVDLAPGARLIEHGVLTEPLRRSLLEAHAVGNVCDYWIDRQGRLVEHSLNDRTVSVPLDVVRQVPRRVLAGGGRMKADILQACLEAGIGNVLITEESAAEALLKARRAAA